MRLRLVTWNVNSVRLRAEQIARFAAESGADVICMQEIKCQEGEFPRAAFEDAARRYVEFYLAHMRSEEHDLLPVAQQKLTEADWAQLDAAFQQHADPLAGGEREPIYDRLFTRIVMKAPAPIGVGPELHHQGVAQ